MEKSWVRGSSIGAGAFGAVHIAYAKAGGRRVFAVKSVSLSASRPASIESLENEICVLRSLRSPHVVAYLGDDTTLDSPRGAPRRNLHLEFMPGGTAADAAAVARADGGPFSHVRDRVRCVARALRYLHDVAGVVHCDVKGRNVLLGRDPRVAKLADFGMAVAAGGGGGGGGGEWARGTPLWMAPEVARGERPTPAADVWSLGCTVIEMATGAPPWPGLDAKDAAGAMLRIGYGGGVPEFPPQMSEVGRDFLDKCLRRDARERWTAEQLLRHPFLAKEGGPAAAMAVDDPSPRGVLEWANWEFHDNDHSIEESCNLDSKEEIFHCAKERIRGLDCREGYLNWCSNSWKLVRSSESKSMAETEEVEEVDQVEAQCHELEDADCSCIRCSVSSSFCHFLHCSSSSSPCCWKSQNSMFNLCNFLSELMEYKENLRSFNFKLLDSQSKFDPKISALRYAASGNPAN